jgi:hypothetical protein
VDTVLGLGVGTDSVRALAIRLDGTAAGEAQPSILNGMRGATRPSASSAFGSIPRIM